MSPVDLRLCAMVDAAAHPQARMAELVADLVRAGATAIVYRGGGSYRASLAAAGAIVAALDGTGIACLIEERADLAAASDAAGLLLRQADIHPRDARALIGAGRAIALTISDPAEADELFRLPVDAALIGLDPAPGLDLDLFGRLAFRAHLAAPGTAVLAGPALAPFHPGHLIGAGADGIARTASDILAGPSRRTEIDIALAARGRP